MSWLLFALAGPFFWALSNIIDEQLVQRIFKEPLGLTVITGVFNVIPLIIIPLFLLPTWVEPISFIAFLTGMLALSLYYPYLKALEITNAAATIVLWNFVPIFVLIFSRIFLQEVLLPTDYLAIVLLVVASLLVTVTRTSSKSPWKAIALMGAASFIYTAELTAEKFIYEQTPFLNGYWWFCLGGFAGAMLVLALHARTRKVLANRLDKQFFSLNLFNEALNGVGGIFVSAAVSLGPVAVVNAVGKVQPLFVLGAVSVIERVVRHKQIQAWKPGFVVRVIIATILSIIAISLVSSDIL